MARYEDQNTSAQVGVCDKTLSFELNGEISLPDYLGEVSRLLWIRPTVLPPATFLNGGNAEFSGRICYQALYAGADGELYSAGLEDTYAFSVPVETDSAALVSAEVVPDIVIGRVAAPRKLTVRCRVHAHVCAYAEKDCSVKLPSEAEAQVCRLGDVQDSGTFCACVGDAVDLYDEFETDNNGVRIIATRGEAFLPDVSPFTDGVRCHGEVIVTMLCCKLAAPERDNNGDEGMADSTSVMPYTIVRRMPLDCEVPLAEICGDHEVRAAAMVSEVRAVAEEGKTTLAVRIVPQIEATCKKPICYTKDLFMPDMHTECSYKEEKIWIPQLCTNKNFSISDNFVQTEIGVPASAAIIDVCAEAEVREKNTDGKQIVMSGGIHCHILYRQGNEYGVAQTEIPFRVMTEGTFETLSVRASVPVCRVQQEKERVRFDAELLVALRASSFAAITPVREAKFLPREACPRADIELCYPDTDLSLWDVAKQYATSPEKIAVANGISDEGMASAASLSGVRYLMIP